MRVRALLPLAAALAASFTSPALAGPGYHQPAVGGCHDYGARALRGNSETSRPVDCAGTHRELTVAVPRLPAGVRYRPVRGTLRAVGARCYRAFFRTLGGPARIRATSAYDLAYFVPTRRERAHGARWVRCDLVLGVRSPQPLPAPLLTSPLDYGRTRCLSPRPFIATACSRPHRYRAKGSIRLRGPFPGRRALLRIGQRRCPALVPRGAYHFTWSSRQAWRAGQKRIVCYTKTRT
jgi:hypothetical protein